MHGVSLIVLNAVARSLRSVVIVLSSLPSKVRAQAARASSVCGDAMALVRGKSKLFLCEAVLASSAFGTACIVVARGWGYAESICTNSAR